MNHVSAAAQIYLSGVCRYTSGVSKRTMMTIALNPEVADLKYRPAHVTCVERKTPLRDVLGLMLGNGMLYAPVTEAKRPIDVISMRDINQFLAPN